MHFSKHEKKKLFEAHHRIFENDVLGQKSRSFSGIKGRQIWPIAKWISHFHSDLCFDLAAK